MQLGHTFRAAGSNGGLCRGVTWLATLRAANQHRRREGIGGAGGRQRECRDRRVRLMRAVILGVPFGPWTAHVVQLRPIGVEQGSGQTVQELADIGSSPRFLAASGTSENCGRCPDHHGIRCTWSVVHPLVGDRAAGVAEKILLGLRIDAIRSHFPRRRVPTAGFAAESTCRRPSRAANQHRRREVVSAEVRPPPRPVDEGGHTWRAIWALDRACSAAPADRGRTRLWPDCARVRQYRQQPTLPCRERHVCKLRSLP